MNTSEAVDIVAAAVNSGSLTSHEISMMFLDVIQRLTPKEIDRLVNRHTCYPGLRDLNEL